MALSRKQMEETIKGGGSVLLPSGKLATRLKQLPSAAQLAKTPEEKAQANADLEARIAKLEAEKAELAAGGDDTLEELIKHSRDQLVQKAAELGVEFHKDAKKAEIAEAILGVK
ncbi:MAG: hypothetical protein KG003_13940 [Bacteroidetes bacterium]|nr:hypothetical protein [Bacteroidota bacterium]